MRKTKKCPKCDCTKLLDIRMVADSNGGGSALTQASLAVRHEGYSFVGNQKFALAGKLQAVTCSECGYTEYYCEDPKKIEPDNKLIFWL